MAVAEILHGDGYVEIDGQRIDYLSHREPETCHWGDRGIDLVMECTGIFTAADDAQRHIESGAGRVLVSAPSKGADATLVFGVNHDSLESGMQIISMRPAPPTASHRWRARCMPPAGSIRDS